VSPQATRAEVEKSRNAFRTISEVADTLGTQPHVLRFWESKFPQVKPVKRAGGRRYYRPADVSLLAGIKQLLHEDGMTIKGAKKLIAQRGVKYVAALSDAEATGLGEIEEAEVIADAPQAAAPVKSSDDNSISRRIKVRKSADPAEVEALYERLKTLHARLSVPVAKI